MYSSITIEGFRCFPRFELHGLNRINLLVGANNSGKTALLEAIALLKAKGRPHPIADAAFRRGEVVHFEDEAPRADIRRIFHGHAVGGEIIAAITGDARTGSARLELRVARLRKIRQTKTEESGNRVVTITTREDDEFLDAPRYLLRKYEAPGEVVLSNQVAAVDSHGGLVWSTDQAPDEAVATTRLVPTGSLSGDELVEMISPLLLTDREILLLEALRIIDDEIEGFRIAPQPSGRLYHSRECVIVKLRGMTSPVPIGSLGDGVWRLFTLATAMASASGGVVLVDDVDTGLHYSVMEQMWRHLAAMATRLDVQVFATTHSRDCYEALSAVEEGSATIHRIERGRTRSVVFGGPMVAAAAANDVEVR
jgi:predicted ATPase